MIQGVIIKNLKTYHDDRGFFREIFRFTQDFKNYTVGQLSHSMVNHGIIKAWHGHKNQSQWNYVLSGKASVVLYDNRRNSLTFGEKMEFLAGIENEKLVIFSLLDCYMDINVLKVL